VLSLLLFRRCVLLWWCCWRGGGMVWLCGVPCGGRFDAMQPIHYSPQTNPPSHHTHTHTNLHHLRIRRPAARRQNPARARGEADRARVCLHAQEAGLHHRARLVLGGKRRAFPCGEQLGGTTLPRGVGAEGGALDGEDRDDLLEREGQRQLPVVPGGRLAEEGAEGLPRAGGHLVAHGLARHGAVLVAEHGEVLLLCLLVGGWGRGRGPAHDITHTHTHTHTHRWAIETTHTHHHHHPIPHHTRHTT
jgi:hypothetical protein